MDALEINIIMFYNIKRNVKKILRINSGRNWVDGLPPACNKKTIDYSPPKKIKRLSWPSGSEEKFLKLIDFSANLL